MRCRSTSDAQRQGMRQATRALMAVMIIVLHDKYGWRDVRLKRFAELVSDQWESCLAGYASVDDLIKLAKECWEGFEV